MPKLDLTKDLIPLSEFRANASPVLRRLREEGGTIVVTHNGKAAAVMMSVQEYQEMLLTIEDLKAMVGNLAGSTDGSKLIPSEQVFREARERREQLERFRGRGREK
jgi:prevent-host-death family protein